MKRRSDEPSDGGNPPTPSTFSAYADTDEPAKKPRTELSSCSSQAEPYSSQPPPEPREPEPEAPELGEDLVFEVLRRAEPRTLAAAACVSRRWRRLAEDERLWEAACVREWVSLGCSEQQLRAVVLPLGGFRRLHAVYLRPIHRRGGAGAPRRGSRPLPARLGRDEVQLSLSLFSIGFFEKMANPNIPKKDGNNDNGKNSGSGCGCG